MLSVGIYRRLLQLTSPVISIIPPRIRLLLAIALKYPGLQTLFDPNSIKNYSSLKYKPCFKKINMDDGTQIYADINDLIGFRIALNKKWDKTTYNFFKFLKQKDILYLDIGANIGSTCIPIAKLGYETIAIEANPETSSILLKNISLNSAANIRVFPIAVGPKKLNRTFVDIYSQPGNMGATSVNKDWDSGLNTQQVQSVYLTTVDDIFKFLDKFASNKNIELIIKIDVEGFETEVLDGAEETINYFRPEIIFENNPSTDSSKSLFWHSLIDYTIFAISPEIEFSHFNKNARLENAIAIPNEKLSIITSKTLP